MVTRRKFAQWTAAALAGVAAGQHGWAMPDKAAQPFKLSVMLWTLRPKYTAEQAIDLVAGAGYNGFELVGEDKKWTPADVQRIRGRMTQLGIVCDTMAGIDTGFAESGAAQKLADELTARMAQAEQLGCRRIILLSGKRDASISREKQHAVCIENLQRAADVAAKHKFVLLLEPIDTLENPSIYLTQGGGGVCDCPRREFSRCASALRLLSSATRPACEQRYRAAGIATTRKYPSAGAGPCRGRSRPPCAGHGNDRLSRNLSRVAQGRLQRMDGDGVYADRRCNG